MQEHLASKASLQVEWSRASERILILEGELASNTNMEVRAREDCSRLEDGVRGLQSEWEAPEERALANNQDWESAQKAFVNLQKRIVINRVWAVIETRLNSLQEAHIGELDITFALSQLEAEVRELRVLLELPSP